MKTLADALLSLAGKTGKGVSFSSKDDGTLNWWKYPDGSQAPTLEEIEAERDLLQDEADSIAYAVSRKEEIIQEWPDYKQFEALTENAMGRPELLQELITFIQSAKEKYPKPSED